MSKNVLIVPVVLLLSMVSLADEKKEPLAVGGPALEFSLKTIDAEKEIKLADYKDKQSLVVCFFSTWSPMSRACIQELMKLYEGYNKREVEFILINAGETKDAIKKFTEKYSVKLAVLVDEDKGVYSKYGVSKVPSVLGIDKTGTVKFNKSGIIEQLWLKSEIEKIAAKERVETKEEEENKEKGNEEN